MKHKTAELEGSFLDAAVAEAEGADWRWFDGLGSMVYLTNGPTSGQGHYPDPYAPSKDWQHGGLIIERERIVFWRTIRYVEPPNPKDLDIAVDGWNALHPESKGLGGYYKTDTVDVGPHDGMFGPTPLIAAMRAFVSSKFGEEIELP